MILTAIILSSIAILLSLLAIVLIWRLNKYIQNTLEEKLEETLDRVTELKKSLEVAVKEGLLDVNGKIKKPYIS